MTLPARWAEENRRQAGVFWSRSRLRVADPFVENLWYQTLHARRCAYRNDTVPPGLFLPSTIQDYSHWHGDYHLNYNFQEPFWADYTANQVELGDAYFQGMQYVLSIGRKIARDYYGTRGVFVQLVGYPIQAEDDPMGVVPMGRMAYMTGWALNQYWWRYLYTLDTNWLRSTGYPVIRDGALFYTDFMHKGEDNLYHVFPSNQGEDGFSGNAKDYTDRSQVMEHLRYCLRAAILASEVLDTDRDLRGQWQERLQHCAGDDGKPPPQLSGLEKLCAEANPPEFGGGRPYRPQPETPEGAPGKARNPVGLSGNTNPIGISGKYPWFAMRRLRGGTFIADRDFPSLCEDHSPLAPSQWTGLGHGRWRLRSRWRLDGVLGCAGAAARDDAAKLGRRVARVSGLAEKPGRKFREFPSRGRVPGQRRLVQAPCGIASNLQRKGAPCRLYPPWAEGVKVVEVPGKSVECIKDDYGRLSFQTHPGGQYQMERLKP